MGARKGLTHGSTTCPYSSPLFPYMQVLTSELPALVGSLSFKKSMRWCSEVSAYGEGGCAMGDWAGSERGCCWCGERGCAACMRCWAWPRAWQWLTPRLCLYFPMASHGFPAATPTRTHTQVTYSRPMRWLLALHGDTALPFVYAGMVAGSHTRVLRNAQQPEQQVRAGGSGAPVAVLIV